MRIKQQCMKQQCCIFIGRKRVKKSFILKKNYNKKLFMRKRKKRFSIITSIFTQSILPEIAENAVGVKDIGCTFWNVMQQNSEYFVLVFMVISLSMPGVILMKINFFESFKWIDCEPSLMCFHVGSHSSSKWH